MPMQLHELHPSVIHMPLALLPSAAVVDVMAASASGRVRRLVFDRIGRTLWWAGVGAAAIAGVAGMAASQEVRAEDPRVRDAMWLHGAGNVAILLAGAGLASWRTTHRATAVTAGLGAGAVGAALYTAWLGGQLVYTHGVGVKTQPASAHGGVSAEAVPLWSRGAPGRLLRDAGRGFAWLLRHGSRLAARQERLAPGAATAAPPHPGARDAGWGTQLRPMG